MKELFSRRTVLRKCGALALAHMSQSALGQSDADISRQAQPRLSPFHDLLANVPHIYSEKEASFHLASFSRFLESIVQSLPLEMQNQATQLWPRMLTEIGRVDVGYHLLRSGRWEELLGIGISQLSGQLECHLPDGIVPFRLFQGGFHLDLMGSALESAGYDQETILGEPSWRLQMSEDEAFDMMLETGMQGFYEGWNNHIALIGDHTVVFASSEQILGEVVSTIQGDTQSILVDQVLSSILTSSNSELITAIVSPGSEFDLRQNELYGHANLRPDQREAERSLYEAGALGAMPPLTMVLLGTSSGGILNGFEDLQLPPAKWEVVATTDTRLSAAAFADGSEARFLNMHSIETRVPYREMLSKFEVNLVDDLSVPTVTIALESTEEQRKRTFLYDSHFSGDLRYLYFGEP